MEEARKKRAFVGKVMKFLIPAVVTVGLCWLMFKHIDYREMVDIIRTQCNFVWIAAAMALSVLSQIFRAMRWNIQLRALGVKTPMFILVLSIFGTYAINLIFPRLGEVWRTGYIAHRQKAPFSTVFGSMLADRLSDTATVLLITIAAFCLASGHLLKYFAQNEEAYRHIMGVIASPWLWSAVAVAIAAAWWMMAAKAKPGSTLDKAQRFVKGIWQGFAVIATMHGKGRWLFYTLLIWGSYFAQMYLEFLAFPFTREVLAHYGLTAVLVTFVFSSIAMGVPSNGGIGPWQWAVAFALALYGIGHTDGMAFANLVLGVNTLVLILLGIFASVCIMLDKRRAARLQ